MATASCTLVGSKGRTSQNAAIAANYSTTTKFYFGHVGPSVSWMSPLVIKFHVPSYSGKASKLSFSLWGYKQGSNSSPTFRYAIASSDANLSMYTNRPSSSGSYYYLPDDPYIISRGTFTIKWSGSSATNFTVECPVDNLSSNNDYVLYVYPYTTVSEYGILYALSDSSHPMSCTMTYTSEFYIYYNGNTYSAVGNIPSKGTKYPGVTYYISSQKPIRDKYKFLGWSTTYDPLGSSSTVQYNPGDPYTTDANLYLYAVWAKDDGTCYICVNGVMKCYQPYVYKDGAWKRCVPYIYTNGEFKLFS